MFNSPTKSFSSIFILVIILSIFIPCLFIPIFSSYEINNVTNSSSMNMSSNSQFMWPTPGYTRITSPFGYRISPTGGTSSDFHSGLDIGAPAGSNLVAIMDGKIVTANFSGSGGFTITIVNSNLRVSYCHVSPSFFVSIGDYVYKGNVIGQVGPKNVYGVPNNPYKDSNGNPTNGSTTGPHLHLVIRKDGTAVDPITLFK